jgi:hypothetical protein
MRLKLHLSILTIAILASCSAQAQNPLVETDPKESKERSLLRTERSLLLSFLTDSREGTRVNALQALAEGLGDKRSLEGIESFLADREGKLSKEEQRKDASVREARKAIEAIKAKLARESKETAEPK